MTNPPKGAILTENRLDELLVTKAKLWATRDHGKYILAFSLAGKSGGDFLIKFEADHSNIFSSWNKGEPNRITVSEVIGRSYRFFWVFENYWDAHAHHMKALAKAEKND